MTRVAVLGAGFMGATHARAYRTLGSVEVAAVYAPTPRRAASLAAEVGARWTDDLDGLLADPAIDAVSVCLPTPEHAAVALAALARGKHVLCEKPLALSLAEADAVVEAAGRSDRVVMVGHVLRFWPEYVAAKRIVASGALGRPLLAHAARLSPFPAWSDLFLRPEATGGAVVDLQVHDFDLLNWIFGPPRRVSAAGTRNPRTGGWDQALVTVAYDGAAALAEGSHLLPDSYPFTATLRVLCERGCLEYRYRAAGRSVEMGLGLDSTLTLYPDGGEPRRVAVEPVDPYQAEIAYFVDRIARGEPARQASPEAAREALRVALAARESLERGEPVSLA